jgi:hypothetical protein
MELVRHVKPTPVEVMEHVFRETGESDDVYWILFKHGTFYTFPKCDYPQGPNDDLLAQVLEMSERAILVDQDGADDVIVYQYRDVWSHPTFVVLSCMRAKIGWVMVGDTDKWPENEQQEAAIGYACRAAYEMDCHENAILKKGPGW